VLHLCFACGAQLDCTLQSSDLPYLCFEVEGVVQDEGLCTLSGKRTPVVFAIILTRPQTEAKFVIFTDNATKRYEDFVDADFQETDDTLGIQYEQKEIHADTILLLRYNCPDYSCDVACYGWPDLHRHVKSVHHKVLCDLCTRNKKVFTHEHELFTPQELRKHEKFGDDHPGAVDQSGFKGHPECGFCRQRFYGDDELYTHCRDKHERCHICDRRNQTRQQQYYIDYESLEQHFKNDHFVCLDQECLEKKFVVFESEMDLKAHQLETHPNGLTKDAKRDARRVDISSFDYRTPHQDDRRARRERDGSGFGRGRGRGRDPNTEALPPSTAQPMRRDELAYQRQMAVQSAQSATARTFGGQLTSTEIARPRPLAPPPQATPTIPPIENLSLNPPSHSLTAQQQARQLQHNAVMDRAASMLKTDSTKIIDFRNGVSSYRSSTITASQLIDTFFSLFDVPSADLGKLIKELADIYENESKRNELLKAWNDWRAVNEDYPSLPGPSGVLPGSSTAVAGTGGRRVLKLKSSTAQSSRSAVSKQRSWGNASPSAPFPSLPAAATNKSAASSVPWVFSSSKPSPVPSRPASRAQTVGKANNAADAFPALPAAAKPNVMQMGLTKGTVRWDDRSSTPAGAWGTGSGAVSADSQDAGEVNDGGKKKGNKNKKQMLYKFG